MSSEEPDDDPSLEKSTGVDGSESAASETATDDATRSVQSTEEWEWVQLEDSQSDGEDEFEDEKRPWDRFEHADQDPDAETETVGSPTDADDSYSSPPESERASGAEIPPPPAVDDRSGNEDLPPPPTAEEQTEDAEPTPEPTDTEIQEMQPLYKRRTREFYLLWLATALSYGLGDMITTSYVFVTPRLGESNPLVSVILGQFGLTGFVATKLGIFGFLIAISVTGAINNERLSYYGPPVLAVLIGLGVTLWNLWTILGL
jgi:hypothetical protein